MFSGSSNPMEVVWMLCDQTGSRKSNMAAIQTGSTQISACRWDRNEIPKATPMFSGSRNSMEILRMLSDQTGSRKSNHKAAILDFRLPVYIAQHSGYFHWVAGPRKHGCSLWNLVPIPSTSWDLSTSGLEAAILDFRLPVWSDSIQADSIQAEILGRSGNHPSFVTYVAKNA